MASSRAVLRPFPLAAAAVAAVSALIVVSLPGIASAAPHRAAPGQGDRVSLAAVSRPRTSQQAGAQIAGLSQQLEVVTEQYNTAKISLGKQQRAARAAGAKLQRIQREARSLQRQTREIAVSEYQNGGRLTSFASFVTSRSPQSVLDQLSTLGLITHRETMVMSQLTRTEKAAERARTEASRALATAQRTATGLAHKKTAITHRIGTLKVLMSRLSAQERAALLERNGSTDRHRALQTPHSDPPTDNPPSNNPPSKQPPSNPPASSKAQIAVRTAEAQIGKPYVWAAAGPDSFDCSGLTMYAWAAAGVSLPHSSSLQYDVGTHVSESELQPGDLVFYYSPIHHVAIYVGGGLVVQAPDVGDVVKYSPVNSMPYVGATRVG